MAAPWKPVETRFILTCPALPEGLPGRLQMRPCCLFLGFQPVFRERGFSQLQRFVNRRPQEREQCTPSGNRLLGLERMDVSRRVNFNFDGLQYGGLLWAMRLFYACG